MCLINFVHNRTNERMFFSVLSVFYCMARTFMKHLEYVTEYIINHTYYNCIHLELNEMDMNIKTKKIQKLFHSKIEQICQLILLDL